MKTRLLFVFLIGLIALLWGLQNTRLRARSQSGETIARQQEPKFYPSLYFEDERIIEQFIQHRDLEGLITFAGKLEKKYAAEVEPFAQLLSRVAEAFSSYDFGDNRQYLFSDTIARKILARSDEIPIETEVAMVRQLRSDLKYIHKLAPISEWPADRAQRVGFLIHLNQRLNELIDRNYDLNAKNNRPSINVCPGNGYLCGIRPDDIKETDVKASYQEALDLNRSKGKKYNLQYKLHKLDSEMPQFVDRFLI